MKKYVEELTEITAAYRAHVKSLQDLTAQVLQLGSRIEKISGEFRIPKPHLGKFPESIVSKRPNIISFPQEYPAVNYRTNVYPPVKKQTSPLPFFAAPGEPLPVSIPDFRHLLQRDGLLLLAWDKRKTEEGYRFTAYWITSSGIPRFYASKPLPWENFPSARPDHKSYAAEDGIEFYGQDAPEYMVHVAPELMKSNPQHAELRDDHIALLRQHGSKVDFNFKYLLKNNRNINLPAKKNKSNLAGA